MDRDRLGQVHQTELTESKVNEDFVDFLKNWGPTILLCVLVVAVGVVLSARWREHQRDQIDSAWVALRSSATPAALLDVARDSRFAKIHAVPYIARLQAAELQLQFIHLRQNIGRTPDDPDYRMTDEQRERALDEVENTYREVLNADEQSRQRGETPFKMTLHAISAMSGMAAVAEARGDVEEARRWYEQAVERAEGSYPELAGRIARRLDDLGQSVVVASLPREEDLGPRPDRVRQGRRERQGPVLIEDGVAEPVGGRDAESRVDRALRDLYFNRGGE